MAKIRKEQTDISLSGDVQNKLDKGGYTGTAKDLEDAINGKVDKEDGKGLSTKDFTAELHTKLKNINTDAFTNKGGYTGTAKDLKDLIDTKVNKQEGKDLSTNDYSNDEKNKVINLSKKVVKGISFTGDVNKRLTLTFEDGTILTADFKDKDTPQPDISPDIALNSMEFDINTGIFTGVRSDGKRITATLNGRFALLEHNHNDLYYSKQEITTELDKKAPKEHTHSFDDLTGKPEIMPEAPTDNKRYTRKNRTWVDIKNAFDFGEAEPLGTRDLNDVISPGVYWQNLKSNTSKSRNYPTENIRGGTLRVLPVSNQGSNIIHQLYTSGGTDGVGPNAIFYREDPRVFLRKLVNGNWIGWFELTNSDRILVQTSANFSTDDLIEEFPQHGASILLPNQNTTILLKKGTRKQIKYIQTSNHSVTFSEESGITAVGETSFAPKIGREIVVTLAGNIAYINSSQGETGIEDAPSDGNTYARKNGGWNLLDFFLSSKGVQELGTQNLNDLKTAGVYRQNRGQDTTKARNYPTENIRGGTLWVLPISEDPLIIHQLLVTGGTTTSGVNSSYYVEHSRIFMRKWVRSQKWSEWIELTTTNRVLTATDTTFTTNSTIEEFTQDKATILLPATASTITIEGGVTRKQIRYIQTENVSTTFVAGSGVQVVGDLVYAGKKGTFIDVVIKDNVAYVTSGDGYLQDAPSDGKDYLRHNNLWKAFEGVQFRELNDRENLNDLKTLGLFGQYNSGAANTARNFPYNSIRGGHLMVLPMTLRAGLVTVFQVYWSAGTQNAGHYTNHARVFMRAFVNNAEWLPWIEFNGGKVHNVVEGTLNLATAYKDFPVNESTFVLNQATTITIPNSILRCTFIKNTDAPITFTKVAGVTLIGQEVINAPIGAEISLVCNGNRAYVNSNTAQSVTIRHNIGRWSK